jgi:hypothetical protein
VPTLSSVPGARFRALSLLLRLALCSLVTAVALLSPSRAQARRLFRARFEVDTLEVEKPGKLAFDAQLGSVYGDGADGSRLILPDFEIDLGITNWLELDIDTGFSYVDIDNRKRKWVGQPIWTALRFDLYSEQNEATGRNFGVGVQAGPRLPNLRYLGGVGFAGLVLFGGGTRTFHVVANLGGTADVEQALAFNYGISAGYEFDSKVSIVGQVAGVYYFRRDTDQLLLLFGVARAITDDLELELLALAGPVHDGDRLGLLVGMTYRTGLW